jgi:uncharacterized membrane protein
LSAVLGIALAVPLSLVTSQVPFALLAWDLASLAFVTSVWATIWHFDGAQTERLAAREDPTRTVADLLTLGAAVASLVAVGVLLGQAARSRGATQELLAGLGLASVSLSWLTVHTVFALRYAKLYYDGPDGGIEFKDEPRPVYSDFAYLAFTIGMTYQVSDTDLRTNEIRRTALRHGLLSFVFGTGIVATTINLIASL